MQINTSLEIISNKLGKIESLLLDFLHQPPIIEKDPKSVHINISEAAKFTDLTEADILLLVKQKELHPIGRGLNKEFLFHKDSLNVWKTARGYRYTPIQFRAQKKGGNDGK